MRSHDAHEAVRPHIEARQAEQAKVNAACTRQCVSPAEAVSLDALAAQYPQVARLRDAANVVATNLELMSDSWAGLDAFKARTVLAEAEKLREVAK